MKEIGNVLSLFDGMSCLQIALIKQGIKFNTYYSSEIDKHAIAQTQLNFSDTIQLGDVTKWREWDIEWSKIDLIGAGSPCQGFSFAGKQLAFDDPRSKLFFVFVEILNHCKQFNPNVKFLLENVNMKKDYLRIISEYVGLFPVNINSNLVSAQNRDRWYWTNIRVKKVGLFEELYTDIPQPKDEGILLRDILDKNVDEKYYINTESMMKFVTDKWRLDKKYTQINGEKGLTQQARQYSSWCGDYVCVAMRGRGENNEQQLEPTKTDKTNSLTSVQKDNLIMEGCIKFGRTDEAKEIRKQSMKNGKDYTPFQAKEIVDLDFEKMNTLTTATTKDNLIFSYRQDNPININKDKFNCLRANAGGQLRGIGLDDNYRIRRLTPNECSKLQTIPSWYKLECSDSQTYKMLGNGWTVDVIAHILSFI